MNIEAQTPVQPIVLYRHERPTPHAVAAGWPARAAIALTLLHHPDLRGLVRTDDMVLLTVANGWAWYRQMWIDAPRQMAIVDLIEGDLTPLEPCPVVICAGMEAAG